jgi:hypothetical protein
MYGYIMGRGIKKRTIKNTNMDRWDLEHKETTHERGNSTQEAI